MSRKKKASRSGKAGRPRVQPRKGKVSTRRAPKRQGKRKTSVGSEHRKRTKAAKRGWETRRARALAAKRSKAAQKAAATRKRQRQYIHEESFEPNTWVHRSRRFHSFTLLYPYELTGKTGLQRVLTDTRRLVMYAAKELPGAVGFAGCILYQRSTDGETWEKGNAPKMLQMFPTPGGTIDYFQAKVEEFYNGDNLEADEHFYRVRISGLAVRVLMKGKEPVKFEGSQFGRMANIVSHPR